MLPTAEEPTAALPFAEAWEEPDAKLESPTKQASRRPACYLCTMAPCRVLPESKFADS